MSKYIIEIAEEYEEYFKGVLICGIADGKFAVDVIAREDLEELNSDYINEHYGELQDEAYQRGHDDGYEAGCATAFKPVSDAEYQRGYNEGYKKCLSVYDFDQPCISCDGYKRGLEDAWEAAQKVVCETTAGGMSLDTLKEIFGVQSPVAIMQSNTAQQAIDKIKTYEDKHSDRIEVGDIVDVYGNLGVVTYMYELKACVMMVGDGSSSNWNLNELKKTGKHYDIASILEAMRE